LLRQYRVSDLVGVVTSPDVGVKPRKILAVVVIDRDRLPEGDRGRDTCKDCAQHIFGLDACHLLLRALPALVFIVIILPVQQLVYCHL
jgi:hypothetical protein